jgi:hypothetical protein
VPPVDRLNKVRTLLPFQHVQQIRRIVKDQQQLAFNLLVEAMRTAIEFLERHGY